MTIITQLFSWMTRLVLVAILGGVFCFLILFGYFLAARSWGMPVILTPGHQSVVQAQPDWLDRNLKVAELEGRIAETRRAIAQARDAKAMAAIAYGSIPPSLAQEQKILRAEINSLRTSTAELAHDRDAAEATMIQIRKNADPEEYFRRGLITRQRMVAEVSARADLANQITTSRARVADNHSRLANLERRASSIGYAIAAARGQGSAGLATTELEQVRSFRAAQLEIRLAKEEVDRLSRSLLRYTEMHDEIVSSLRPLAASPLRAAARGTIVVVFVPYENAGGFQPGAQLYGCRLWLIWCDTIGRLAAQADGEVTQSHPLYGKSMRGLYFSVNLEGAPVPQAARHTLVFSRKPLLI